MTRRRARPAVSVLSSLPEEIKAHFTAQPPTPSQAEDPPRKKQKTKEPVSDEQRHWAYGLVPHYSNKHEVPERLQKYFSQRLRLFSLYQEGCLLDEEGWYSVTPERVAIQIAERCRCDLVLDAFCGVGGNAIAFAQTCERVIAMDTSPVRLALARHNAAIYGVADRIEFILMDYLSFIRSQMAASAHQRRQSIDVVFLSPPWGGVDYLSAFPSPDKEGSRKLGEEEHPDYSLNSIPLPVSGGELFRLTRQAITRNIAFYLPRNVNIEEVASLAEPGEIVELEEEWMGNKLKATTSYFGGLAKGQDVLRL